MMKIKGLKFKKRLCVPVDAELRNEILHEAYASSYSVHPGRNKMVSEVRKLFWWKGLKKDVAGLVCQKIKSERRKEAGLTQPLDIPDWKWDSISMGFVVGLPRSRRGNEVSVLLCPNLFGYF